MRTPRFVRDHVFARRRLSAYVDGELTAEESRRVRRHVAECRDCGDVERSLGRLVDSLNLLRARGPSRLADQAIERVRAATPADGAGEGR